MSRRITKNPTVPAEGAIRNMRGYLKEYSVFRKLLEEEMSEGNSFGNPSDRSPRRTKRGASKTLSDATLRIRLFEIRRFILSHPEGDEKLFLFLRYIHGETMGSCACKMGISERTAYRLHKRALASAARRMEEDSAEPKNTKCYE